MGSVCFIFVGRGRSHRLHGASHEERDVGFSCLTWLCGLFARTLISVTNAYACCGRPTLNFGLGFVFAVIMREKN